MAWRRAEGTLKHFHSRLAHFNYGTIIKMVEDPVSGIKVTDGTHENCVVCAQIKQT